MAKVTITESSPARIRPGTLVRWKGGTTVLLVTKVGIDTVAVVSLHNGAVYNSQDTDKLEPFNGVVALSNE